jgi:DNA modification methylase
MKPYYKDEQAELFVGDSAQNIFVRDNSVDLVVTSPPYKEEDGFSIFKLTKTFQNVYSMLRNDSLFFLNFGHLQEDKFRPFEVCKSAMSVGFKLKDTIV